VQRLRDFLSAAWPVAAEACAHPVESVTWLAALQVVTSRCAGQPEKLAAVGLEAFTAAVRGALAGWGGQRVAGQVCRAVFAALTDTEGVIITHRRGLLRRCAGELGDLQRVRAQLRETEADMAAVLGELGLARLGDIPGLTAVGAAAVLAETGDPRRYDSSSSLVKHAGLSPAENASGAFEGQAHISRRGRPGLRLAVWRAVWPLLIHNPVMAAKYAAMTAAGAAAQASSAGGSRQASAAAAARARRAKARVACAASLLRWIYSMAGCGTGWDPTIASGAASCPAEAA
jgi:transposase